MKVSHSIIALMILGTFYYSAGFSSLQDPSANLPIQVRVWDSLEVTASAYNSLRWQTGGGDPTITAWGDTLRPGMKAVAVSRDLIRKGLNHDTAIIIEGFPGVFLVKDKMHPRWKNKIDIYMGEDVEKAREWGKRKVMIYFKDE